MDALPVPRAPASRLARLVVAILLAATLCASGCGGGGGGGGGGDSPFAIVTASLPVGGADVPYTTYLQATGGVPPYFWQVTPGSSLPPGIGLASTGSLSGTPTALGSFAFDVSVTDSATTPETDTASYTLTVSAFDASIGLLRWGDAWTGESYPVSAVGGASVTFSLVQNQSGGMIANANPAAGTATYVAGSSPGADRIRASDGSGNVEDLDVNVRTSPVGNMTARFTGTDVWYLRFAGKENQSHAYVNDFDESMTVLGFRAPTSIDAAGTTADQIAWTWIRQQTLRYLNAYYLNEEDGSPKPGGLEISFPFDEPAPPHFHPSDGAVNGAAYNQYNVISFLHGNLSGVLGTAYMDESSNDSQENDTTTGDAGELGVFTDELTSYFNAAWHNDTLSASPVSSADVTRLKALLYGTAMPGDARYDEMKRIGEAYARTMAAVAAHEIGHSLSLVHTSPSQSGSIMNSATVIGPGASYSFTSGDVIALQVALPGPNRGGVPSYAADLPDVAWLTIGPEDGIVLGAPKSRCAAGSCVVHRRPAR